MTELEIEHYYALREFVDAMRKYYGGQQRNTKELRWAMEDAELRLYKAERELKL